MDYSNKVALVTGGASGLGNCCVEEFLKNGIKGVIIADINWKMGEKVSKDFNNKYGNGRTTFIKTDIADKISFEDAFKKAIEIYGNIDILVNNAGIVDEINWERAIQINLVGTTHGCLLAINKYFPKHKSSPQTFIINISSTAGLYPASFIPHYCSTKHGVTGLSKSLGTNPVIAKEDICIMCLCPGPTNTPIACNPSLVYKELYDSSSKEVKSQQPDVVGKAVIKMVQGADSGSVWMIINNVLYKVKISEKLKFSYRSHL